MPSSLFLLLLLAATLLTTTTAVAASSSAASSACKSSFYPKLCRALLKPLKFPSTYDSGRYSVKQALKQAKKTSKILDHYLSRGGAHRASQGGALEDCRQLADANAAYLEAVRAELGAKERVLTRPGVERVRALMSAVVTNQETCYDGLQQASSAFPEDFYGVFAEETKMYGLSLELVSSALEGKGGEPPAVSPGGTRGSEIGRKLEEEGQVSAVPLRESVLVAQDGTGNFTTIADAVAFAPNNTLIDDGYFGIFVSPGVYRENILVPKNKRNLIMFGAGMDETIITGNRSVVDGWTTYNSATFAVHGERFIAIDMAFENTAGPEKHQAVAVRNSADISSFYRCRFAGYQDTLYAHSLRQFYRDCEVSGTVDFIFGNAASVFQDCLILARRPLPHQTNVVTAQGRVHPNQTTGISIHNCTIRPAPDLESDTRTFLGRPWKEYSRTVVMQSSIGGFVEPAGWLEWNGTFALGTLYYGEFENTGAGADTGRRVGWEGHSLMNVTEAWNFTVYNFTTGDVWLSSTPVPYAGGLL